MAKASISYCTGFLKTFYHGWIRLIHPFRKFLKNLCSNRCRLLLSSLANLSVILIVTTPRMNLLNHKLVLKWMTEPNIVKYSFWFWFFPMICFDSKTLFTQKKSTGKNYFTLWQQTPLFFLVVKKIMLSNLLFRNI